MKRIAVVYYSFSGNTRRVAEFIKEYLNKEGYWVELIEIKPLKEPRNFFARCKSAFRREIVELVAGEKYDLSDYECVIFGSPVWSFNIPSALRSYLNIAKGLKHKKTGFFLTCGIAALAEIAFDDVRKILVDKGADIILAEIILGRRTADKEYLEEVFFKYFEFFPLVLSGKRAPLA